MDELTDKWLQAAESAGPDNPAEFIDSIGGLEKYAEDIIEIYRRSGNRLFLLELFNVLALQGADNDVVQIPTWLINEFAHGFGLYMQNVMQNPGAGTLEESLGITSDMRNTMAHRYLLSKATMVRQVHRLRYHFKINVDQACYIVYEANKGRFASLTGADSPTERFTDRSFLQHYYRDAAKDFSAWEKEAIQRGEYPTPERQADILNLLGPELAEKVREAAKLLL